MLPVPRHLLRTYLSINLSISLSISLSKSQPTQLQRVPDGRRCRPPLVAKKQRGNMGKGLFSADAPSHQPSCRGS